MKLFGYRISTWLTAAAGVIIYDALFSGVAGSKLLQLTGLGARSLAGCACGGGCDSCAKNVTDRAQVIDVTPVNSKYAN